MSRDTRRTERVRVMTITLIDREALPFSGDDLEWIGEQFEDAIKRRFDVDVDDVQWREDAELTREHRALEARLTAFGDTEE